MDKKVINNIWATWQEVVMNEKKKLDPVDKDELKGKYTDRDDKDIDNDGDADSSDQYLHKKRKAISKAMKSEAKCKECGMQDCKCNHESVDLDANNAEKALRHDCATHVASESWGYGECIPGEHTLVEQEDGSAIVTHYDVMFEHGIEKNVPVSELNIIAEKSHMHASKKKTGMSLKAQKACEETEIEEKLETQRSKLPNGQRPKGPGWVLKKSGEQSGKPHSEWERKFKRVESVNTLEGYQTVAETHEEIVDAYAQVRQQAVNAMKSMWERKEPEADKKAKPDPKGQPGDEIDNGLKGGGAQQMAKDLDATGTDKTKIPKGGDDEDGHRDVSKAGRAVSKQAPARPGDKR